MKWSRAQLWWGQVAGFSPYAATSYLGELVRVIHGCVFGDSGWGLNELKSAEPLQ